MKEKLRSGCSWQKEQFNNRDSSVQCKWATIRALVLRMNLRAAAFQLGSSTIAKPSKRGGVGNCELQHIPSDAIHTASFTTAFLSDYCNLCNEFSKLEWWLWTKGKDSADVENDGRHVMELPSVIHSSPGGHTCNCWGLCLRKRCPPTTFHTIAAGDANGWCLNWLVWSVPSLVSCSDHIKLSVRF
jgi:hypothetical protein